MHFQQINVTHCRGQLLPIDVPLHPQSIPPSLQPFRRLLRSWAGLRVLLAGDSLARQFFLAVHCTAHLLGATVNTTLPPLRLRERNLTDGFAASVGVALDGLSACFRQAPTTLPPNAPSPPIPLFSPDPCAGPSSRSNPLGLRR
eukprot:GGOE01045180.1.p1 GENE.GGOE01045180.1~~GGOE01045180.1.p1  ORF type:complete len:144 (+),score=31.47 GGOE01045180.1:89-520(+)